MRKEGGHDEGVRASKMTRMSVGERLMRRKYFVHDNIA